MTSTSSSSEATTRLAPPQHDPRRCAVRTGDPDRETNHLVNARLDMEQIQPFDHDRTRAEEDVVRRCAGIPKELDREIVDADDLDAAINKVACARFGDA